MFFRKPKEPIAATVPTAPIIPAVFISHSSANAEIAKQLSGLLQKIGIPSERLFCSSVLGQGVNNGEKLNDSIYQSLKEAGVIIYLLSDAFIRSSYCMEELGIGWYFAFDKSKTCCYLYLPDIEMSELKGFVNSKIDKFSVVNVPDDIILFIENICEVVYLGTPKASVASNYANTFVSAIRSECQDAIDKKTKQKEKQEQYEKEVFSLNERIKKNEEVFEAFKNSVQLKEAESKKESLRRELIHIIDRFQYLGSVDVIDKEFILDRKGFIFDMVNRYEELHSLLGIEPQNSSMERLLAQAYLACENYEAAHQHFLHTVKIQVYMARYEVAFFAESYPYSLGEIIHIMEDKHGRLPEGQRKDLNKGALEYMKEVERKKNVASANAKSTE